MHRYYDRISCAVSTKNSAQYSTIKWSGYVPASTSVLSNSVRPMTRSRWHSSSSSTASSYTNWKDFVAKGMECKSQSAQKASEYFETALQLLLSDPKCEQISDVKQVWPLFSRSVMETDQQRVMAYETQLSHLAQICNDNELLAMLYASITIASPAQQEEAQQKLLLALDTLETKLYPKLESHKDSIRILELKKQSSFHALLELGAIYNKIHDFVTASETNLKAIKVAKQLLESADQDTKEQALLDVINVQNQQAETLYHLGKPDEARTQYEATLDIIYANPTMDFNKEKAQSFYGLASCHLVMNEYAAAVGMYQEYPIHKQNVNIYCLIMEDTFISSTLPNRLLPHKKRQH